MLFVMNFDVIVPFLVQINFHLINSWLWCCAMQTEHGRSVAWKPPILDPVRNKINGNGHLHWIYLLFSDECPAATEVSRGWRQLKDSPSIVTIMITVDIRLLVCFIYQHYLAVYLIFYSAGVPLELHHFPGVLLQVQWLNFIYMVRALNLLINPSPFLCSCLKMTCSPFKRAAHSEGASFRITYAKFLYL